MFRTPAVNLQEDGCINRCGIGCFTSISISSLVGRRVCIDTLLQYYNIIILQCTEGNKIFTIISTHEPSFSGKAVTMVLAT
jgi:hypothetical protein